MRLIIVSGLSGSGKSVALHLLEDIDFYCVDNIPAALLKPFISHTIRGSDDVYPRTAVGLDARNRANEIETIPALVAELRRSGINCEVLYLHASDEVLLKRYAETRRKHPLISAGLSLREAIDSERRLLEPITSTADLVIDVRALPNPFWEHSLRHLTGRDQEVMAYLASHASVGRMTAALIEFLSERVAEFAHAHRSYLTIAVGCTGGQHRSVYMAERLAEHFRQSYPDVLTRHDSLEKS